MLRLLASSPSPLQVGSQAHFWFAALFRAWRPARYELVRARPSVWHAPRSVHSSASHASQRPLLCASHERLKLPRCGCRIQLLSQSTAFLS